MFSFVTVNEYCSPEKCNDKIKNKLIGKKFKKIKEGHQNVWIKLPAPVQLATPATRVPVRPPTPATPSGGYGGQPYSALSYPKLGRRGVSFFFKMK
jgi:hypothetical protein